jgi:hypothetical protein
MCFDYPRAASQVHLIVSLSSFPISQYPVRLFVELGFDMVVCQSFAKNFGLYAERIGATHVVVVDKAMTKPVLSQLEVIIRPMYSNVRLGMSTRSFWTLHACPVPRS